MLFSGHSRQGRRNADGSFRIYCVECREYISDSYVQLGKVTCAICEAALAGRPLTADAIALYNASKLGRRDVTLIRVEDEVTIGENKFSFRSLAGSIAQALGFPKQEEKPLESVRTSKAKQRGRLFQNVDLEQATGIGSMEEIDRALNASKDK